MAEGWPQQIEPHPSRIVELPNPPFYYVIGFAKSDQNRDSSKITVFVNNERELAKALTAVPAGSR
jgi:hypothetical protein